MKTSVNFEKISEAYLNVQNDLICFEKDTSGDKNKYTSYEDLIKKIKPLLTAQGILLFQPLSNLNGEKSIITRIQKEDQFMESEITISELKPMISSKGNEIINAPQRDGMSITYMKRYALSSFFAIATGERDFDSEDIKEANQKKSLIEKAIGELDQAYKEEFLKAFECIPKDIEKQREFYKYCKDIVVPKLKEDEETAIKMLNNYAIGE